MKTAAAIVIVLALAGLFGKDKKKHQPPPIQTRPPVFTKFDCGEPGTVPFNETSKQRILKFGMGHKTAAIPDDTMEQVAHYTVVYAASYCIEPELAAALIARESRFNPNAVSPNGAKGLGQLIDSTARNMGVSNPFDIQQNLRGSLGYFKLMMDKWQGRSDQIDLALASYLIGPGNVERCSCVPDSSRIYINDIYAYRQKMLGM